MSTLCRSSKTDATFLSVNSQRRAITTVLIGSMVMIGLSGCGQKGDLYLADSTSQTIESSSSVLDSTSNPQDAAFAGIDDNQASDMMGLPEPSDDPNDY